MDIVATKVNGAGSNPPECILLCFVRTFFLREERTSGKRESVRSQNSMKIDARRRAGEGECRTLCAMKMRPGETGNTTPVIRAWLVLKVAEGKSSND